MGFPAEEPPLNAENCTQASVREGIKAAALTCVITAVPVLTAARTIPWAKANLNHTGQALIISGASIAAYFITADKTILKAAKKNAQYDRRA
ncbi:hypothetical protein U1Q18_018861 [Sarracenia purpurea var. burkii]